MKLGRPCAIALAALNSIAVLASIPLRAQNEIPPAVGIATVNKAAFRDAFGSFLQSQTAEGSGSIMGSVVAVDGTGVVGAEVTLTNIGAALQQTRIAGQITGLTGEFAFA